MKRKITDGIKESAELRLSMLTAGMDETVEVIATAVLKTVLAGGKTLIAGNGGSAADAQHIAAEFVGRYLLDRAPIASIALTTNTSSITAISNDIGYDHVFSRQVEALGNKGDLFWAISTSGQSKNLVNALGVANDNGLVTISFLGKSGGEMKGLADIDLVIPSDNTPRIQEAHIMVAHLICEAVENSIVNGS